MCVVLGIVQVNQQFSVSGSAAWYCLHIRLLTDTVFFQTMYCLIKLLLQFSVIIVQIFVFYVADGLQQKASSGFGGIGGFSGIGGFGARGGSSDRKGALTIIIVACSY